MVAILKLASVRVFLYYRLWCEPNQYYIDEIYLLSCYRISFTSAWQADLYWKQSSTLHTIQIPLQPSAVFLMINIFVLALQYQIAETILRLQFRRQAVYGILALKPPHITTILIGDKPQVGSLYSGSPDVAPDKSKWYHAVLYWIIIGDP